MTVDNTLIRISKSSEQSIWDTYVDAHIHGSPYHKSAWGNAVSGGYNFEYISIVALNETTNTLVGIFPLVMMKIPLKGKTLCALPYCDLGGPLADSEEIKLALVQYARKFANQQGAARIQIRGSDTNPLQTEDLTGQKVRMLLPLPPSSETLLASFKSKLRSQIRKAEKNGLTYKTGNENTLLEDFYHVYCVNMRDLGSPAHHKNWFQHIVENYAENALISVVYHEQTPIGGGIVLLNENTASIPWASTIQAFNRLAPNMLLYWSVLATCADKHITTFDFGRSTFNEGTYKFKKQWGAEPVKLDWQEYASDGAKQEPQENQSESSNLRAHVENIWRKLPLPLTVFLGGKVRKYISL